MPELTERQRLHLAAYYYGQVSSGWVAEKLGFPGRPELWAWMRDRHGLPYLLGASEEDLVALRTELWAEGTPPEEIDRLFEPPPALRALLESAPPPAVEALLAEYGLAWDEEV